MARTQAYHCVCTESFSSPCLLQFRLWQGQTLSVPSLNPHRLNIHDYRFLLTREWEEVFPARCKQRELEAKRKESAYGGDLCIHGVALGVEHVAGH